MSANASSPFMGWDEQGSGNRTGVKFLKLEAGKTYDLRLIGRPIPVWNVFLGERGQPGAFMYRSPYYDKKGVMLDPLMIAEPELKDKAKEKYASWVIDRADGFFKITDFNWSLKNAFANWRQMNLGKGNPGDEEPGGPKGSDWRITSTGSGQGTRWTATSGDRTQLTEKELQFMTENNLQKLLYENRRANTTEEIMVKYNKYKAAVTDGQQKGGQKQAATPSIPPPSQVSIPAPTQAAPQQAVIPAPQQADPQTQGQETPKGDWNW